MRCDSNQADVPAAIIANSHTLQARRIRAEYISIFLCAFFAALFATELVVFAQLAHRIDAVAMQIQSAQDALRAQTWTGQLDPMALSMLTGLDAAHRQTARAGETAYSSLMAFDLIIVSMFAPAAILHIRLLRRFLRQASQRNRSISINSLGSEERRNRAYDRVQLRRTVGQLIVEMLAVLFAATIFATLCLWITIDGACSDNLAR